MTALTLHDYQRVGVDYLRAHPEGAGLFLDMGLGKTATALSALEPRHLPALVVAPKRVAETVWDAERDLWRPDLTLQVVQGTPRVRAALLDNTADITVISRENMADAIPFRDRYRTLILDELSGFKGRGVRWRAARKLTQGVQLTYRWGLTGTPSPNGYLDLWPQIALLDDGARLGRTLGEYRNRYFLAGNRLPNGIVSRWDPREGTIEKVNGLLEDLCLSMQTEGRIELPPVTYNFVSVELPPAARQVYRTMKKKFVVHDIGLLGTVTAPTAGALSNKLGQISAGFLFEDERTGRWAEIHREKMDALKEIVEGTGSPVLVFYRYRPEADMIVEALGSKVTRITEPGAIVEWNLGNVPVLLAHPASAGHGLNLQHGGHTIVWTSLTWSLEEWQQSNKRLARQGQKHPVVIHALVAPRTVDLAMRDVLDGKKDVQQALLDHLESPL